MIINALILRDFIKKASLNGDIMAINMDFTDTGIASSVRDVTNITITKTFLKKEAFKEYEAMGEIFIKDTAKFLKYLDTFGSDITIGKLPKVENVLFISDDTRDGFIILGGSIVCENVYREDFPKIDTTTTIVLPKSELARTLSDMKDLLKEDRITIVKEGDKAYTEIGTKNQSDYFKNSLNATTIVGEDARVMIGNTIISLYASIDSEDDITLNLGKDIPIIISEKGEMIEFSCIIAPMYEEV